MKLKIIGNLDIFVARNEEEGEEWDEVLIHGDSEGLKSLAQLLIEIANVQQEKIADDILPIGAREHITLMPNQDLSKSSNQTIIGRLDAKNTGEFYESFIPKD